MPEKKVDPKELEQAEGKLQDAQKAVATARLVLETKQDQIGKAFEFAGDGDQPRFDTPELLSHCQVSGSKEAARTVRRWNDEAALLGVKYESADRSRRLAEQTVNELKGQKGDDKPVNAPPLPDGVGPTVPAAKTIGQLITGSKPYKNYRETRSPSGDIVEGYGITELKAHGQKTLFQTSAGWAPESTRIAGLIEAVTRPIQVLDIIPSGNTDKAAVVYMEETTRTHASAERAEAAAYAESTFEETERSSTVRSIGTSVPVTDEQLEDVAGVQSYLEQRLVFGNRQRLDLQVLQGDGAGANLTGILNTGSIQTQAKGADPVPDTVYKAMTKVRVTGRAFPNAFVVHPNDWQDVRLLRTADGIYIWGSPSEAGPERIWGIQVVQSDALTENTGLVGDFANFCMLYERRGMEVLIGYVDDDFLKGKRTIRAGFRVAFVVRRATAFCTCTSI